MKKLLLLGLLLGAGGWLILRAGWMKPPVVSFEKSEEKKERELVIEKVKNVVGKAQGEYGFWVWRLGKGDGYGWNEDKLFPLVSIVKVPIMTAALKAVDEKKLALTDVYQVTNEEVRDGTSYGAGDSLNIEKMLWETGVNSDNITPVVLVRAVGEDAMGEISEKLGLGSSGWQTKGASARGIGEMWNRLENGGILSRESKTLLWNDLTDSIYEDRIPAGLPAGTKVVHKAGTGDGVWADAGIVIPENSNPFVLVIVNKEVDLEQAKDIVPKMVKIIWEEESKQKTADAK